MAFVIGSLKLIVSDSIIHVKDTVSGYKGCVLLFSETFEINHTMWRQVCSSAGSIADRMASTTPIAVVRSSLTHLMMAGKAQKWRLNIEKQTDSSAPLSILVRSILLALLPDHMHRQYYTSRSGMGKWCDPDITNCNTWSAYTDIPIFLTQKNTKKNVTKRHGFYFYPLYSDTVPLIILWLSIIPAQERPLVASLYPVLQLHV